MITEQDVRAMTKPEKVAALKARGWTRLESHGAQTWVSPDGQEMGTLAYSVRRAFGTVGPRATGCETGVS